MRVLLDFAFEYSNLCRFEVHKDILSKLSRGIDYFAIENIAEFLASVFDFKQEYVSAAICCFLICRKYYRYEYFYKRWSRQYFG